MAAHWRYKDGANASDGDDQRVVWMRQLIEWAREMREPSEFLSTLKVDLYPEEVYIFTPKGKVLTLPRGATPVDFAYSIHTDVGHQCVGAKVNGQMVPLRHPLSNGDVVEIAHAEGPWSEPRLAQLRAHLTRAIQNPAMDQPATNASKPRKWGGG